MNRVQNPSITHGQCHDPKLNPNNVVFSDYERQPSPQYNMRPRNQSTTYLVSSDEDDDESFSESEERSPIEEIYHSPGVSHRSRHSGQPMGNEFETTTIVQFIPEKDIYDPQLIARLDVSDPSTLSNEFKAMLYNNLKTLVEYLGKPFEGMPNVLKAHYYRIRDDTFDHLINMMENYVILIPLFVMISQTLALLCLNPTHLTFLMTSNGLERIVETLKHLRTQDKDSTIRSVINLMSMILAILTKYHRELDYNKNTLVEGFHFIVCVIYHFEMCHEIQSIGMRVLFVLSSSHGGVDLISFDKSLQFCLRVLGCQKSKDVSQMPSMDVDQETLKYIDISFTDMETRDLACACLYRLYLKNRAVIHYIDIDRLLERMAEIIEHGRDTKARHDVLADCLCFLESMACASEGACLEKVCGEDLIPNMIALIDGYSSSSHVVLAVCKLFLYVIPNSTKQKEQTKWESFIKLALANGLPKRLRTAMLHFKTHPDIQVICFALLSFRLGMSSLSLPKKLSEFILRCAS